MSGPARTSQVPSPEDRGRAPPNRAQRAGEPCSFGVNPRTGVRGRAVASRPNPSANPVGGQGSKESVPVAAAHVFAPPRRCFAVPFVAAVATLFVLFSPSTHAQA